MTNYMANSLRAKTGCIKILSIDKPQLYKENRMGVGKLSIAVAAVIALAAGPVMSGTISGVVKIDAKKIPPVKAVKMDSDPDCVAKHTEPHMSERYVVDADNNVKNVFVYIKTGLEGQTFESPKRPAELDQVGCAYSPRVLGLMVGQPLRVLNSDRLLHNVHMTPKVNEEFNKAMPPRVRKMPVPGKVFSQPEVMVPFKCDVHPWMKAYIGVLPHPFFGVSAADGSFTIEDVPPGKYTVEAWHEFFTGQVQEIEVAEGAVTVNFGLKPPSRKKKK